MAPGVRFKMAAKIFKSYSLSMVLITCWLILAFLGTLTRQDRFNKRIAPHSQYLKNIVADITAKCWRKVEEIEYIKQLNVNNAAFEVGYLVQNTQDKYRKMVDKYHTVQKVGAKHYIFEIFIYLQEIEHHYWQIEHIASEQTLNETLLTLPFIKPLNQTILENAPWSIKLLMLKDMYPPKMTTQISSRRVGVESLVQRRQDPAVPEAPKVDPEDDENNMRLKLFRLMYETVRDSDLKVKRAELIRKHYTNSSAFEVGFLMGEVQEKFDIIQEFSGTLQKFYDAWKPIEHINAYEQIANYAIQVNHLVDLVRSIGKNST